MIECKMCVLILSTDFFLIFLILRRILQDIFIDFIKDII